ncbi:MAG TPA: fumarylacetoacetate hydrolase family protein, partial [Mycobacterium sp.]|nr:fumarylacetoacetate hydrolase family protein [Mycobacterium sp.]
MRLVTFDAGNGPRAGVETGSGIIDAWDLLGEDGDSGLRGLLARDRLADLAAALEEGNGEAIDRAGLELLAPVPDPEKIICIGLNYRAHAEEAGMETPKAPTIFGKYKNALVADGSTVKLPAASSKVDYEAEVAFVIGKRASEIPLEEAIDHIAGYTLLNDLSARDLQFLTPQWMAGKVFDGSAPCGPALVTIDEAGAPDTIGISLDLNGERLQESS